MAYTGDFIRRLGETEFLRLGQGCYLNIRCIQLIQLMDHNLILLTLEGDNRIWVGPRAAEDSEFPRLMHYLKGQGFFKGVDTSGEPAYSSVEVGEDFPPMDDDDF